jgi:hypothetical protein
VLVANALPSGWSNRFLARGLGAIGGGAFFCSMALKARAPAGADLDDEDCDFSSIRPSSPKKRLSKSKAPVTMAKAGAPAKARSSGKTLFDGVPAFDKAEALLFDSTRGEDAKQLPKAATFTQLKVEFPKASPDPDKTSENLAVLLFVDDLTSPRAKVRVIDLLRQNGLRPLNLVRRAEERIRIVLVDPDGAWADSAPKIKVSLQWA